MSRWARIAFWVVVAGQLVFLLAFIAFQETDLRTGDEVVLQTAPVDPRSLLQGDYAILDYEIATLPPDMQDSSVGDPVFVALEDDDEGVWRADGYYRSRRFVEDGLFIKGQVDRPGHADFGIGTYFIPEGTGHIIEGAADVKVAVKVDADGSAIISDVLVDGLSFAPELQRKN